MAESIRVEYVLQRPIRLIRIYGRELNSHQCAACRFIRKLAVRTWVRIQQPENPPTHPTNQQTNRQQQCARPREWHSYVHVRRAPVDRVHHAMPSMALANSTTSTHSLPPMNACMSRPPRTYARRRYILLRLRRRRDERDKGGPARWRSPRSTHAPMVPPPAAACCRRTEEEVDEGGSVLASCGCGCRRGGGG